MPWIHIVSFRTSITAAAFCLGCGVHSAEPEIRWELLPGTLEFHDQPIAFDLPQVAAVGLTTVITVRTFGGGCTRQGPTEVEVTGLTAIVQPMDSSIVPFPDLACTEELLVFEHRVELRFAEAGVATVRVLGRREPGGGPVEFERTLVVQ
jgi:hypothetical protein